jgi:anti-anti-sigma factor
MSNALVDVQTIADGSVVVQPHGIVGAEIAVELRQVLVHVVRRLRPVRLILDLGDVHHLDSINVGTVAAVCDLAADHQVAIFVDNSTPTIGSQLHAAGVHHRHLRTLPAPTGSQD